MRRFPFSAASLALLVALLLAMLSGVALAKVVEGNNRPNNLFGTNNEDELFGFGANDSLCGADGDDTYFGGDGPDSLSEFCEKGNDSVDFANNDTMNGEDGTDFIEGNEGNDKIKGGKGDDNTGTGQNAGFAQLFGDEGNDRIFGGKGNDGMEGEEGEDKLFGEEGNDFLDAADGEDVPEADLVDGGPGRDVCVVNEPDTVRNCERVVEETAQAASAESKADDAAEQARARERFLAEHAKRR